MPSKPNALRGRPSNRKGNAEKMTSVTAQIPVSMLDSVHARADTLGKSCSKYIKDLIQADIDKSN